MPTAYSCTPAACQADPGPQLEAFRALQVVINRFGQAASFAPVPTDGVLTPQTLTAVTAIAVLFGLTPPASLAALAADASGWITALSAETIAPEALDALDADRPLPVETVGMIEQLARSCRRDAGSPTCVQARALCQYARGAKLDQLPVLRELCAAPSLAPSRWLVAGLLAAAAAGTGYVIWRRRQPGRRARARRR